jgi:hypothetical protein
LFHGSHQRGDDDDRAEHHGAHSGLPGHAPATRRTRARRAIDEDAGRGQSITNVKIDMANAMAQPYEPVGEPTADSARRRARRAIALDEDRTSIAKRVGHHGSPAQQKAE